MSYMKLIKGFSDKNPERFNEKFIRSKSDNQILPQITNIFKSLEIIPEIKINSIEINTDEECYGPIKQQGHYYKSPLESRLSKIHYKVTLCGEKTIEKDLFIPKMLDNCFYVNEGVRFYPIWQVVDNLSYPTNNGVSLKSLMMGITLIKADDFELTPEFNKTLITCPTYCMLIFNKKVSPLYYFMLQYSLKSLENAGISPFENLEKYQEYADESLISKINTFLGINLKFNDDPLQLAEDGRTVFKLTEKKETGLSMSIKDSDLATDYGKKVIGLFMGLKTKDKKGKLVYSYKQLITPWFWIDNLIESSGFSKSSDAFKRLEKVKNVSISLDRLIDNQTRETLPISRADKSDIYAIIKYLLIHFDELFKANPQDLHKKRIRLYEYILFPLRAYFGQHINRLINSQNGANEKSIEKVFTSLTPMFLVKNLITSQLLRTYNSTNDFNLFSAYLKGTFKGPQALNKGVSFEKRDLDPSYINRIGLVAASPGDPGVTFTFSPFLKVYNGFFDEKEEKKTHQD